ncbi:PHP domain-containing protein [Gordonia jinghuaiqii]|uniref:PHP domain-containing protein n=1 Tax=Gordonia jinghuaiqii TaxID=2758710 RepID=A0A7D7LQ23_9ACTN|nr:PHP domain-containing protein [Gordonia jinghuaiqii]MCR5976874.1 PHP domain-containing protein [Gordonia jinghuaiqii]QMT00500.1 PHP domain-containing protein [Gordonia jinghuaiqii]
MKSFEPLTSPVDPVEALTRISWLLERRRESTYRVEAFRRAARAADRLDPSELRDRSAAGTLTAIDGIGKTTAAVITESVDGRLPTYLSRLQDDDPPISHDGADAMVDAVRGDLHAHTEWSDGGASIDEMASAAMSSGHEWLAITDHSPRLTVANGLDAQRLASQIEVIDDWNRLHANGFRLLRGIEIDILDDGALDQSDEMIARLDVVTASVHSHLRMPHDAMTSRLVAAVSDPRVHVLGHCTGRRVLGGRGHRPPSTFDARTVFEACAANNTAVEINSRPERVDPPDELIEIALAAGCLFAIDSDAHAPGQLEFKILGAQRAVSHQIDPERIVTTWSSERLLDWISR